VSQKLLWSLQPRRCTPAAALDPQHQRYTASVTHSRMHQVARLLIENAFLRQQVALMKTKRRAVRLRPWRRLLLALATLWAPLREATFIVQPATLTRWHRSLWSLLWALRTRRRHKTGRPPIDPRIAAEIRRIATAHRTWGIHRIKNELAKLSMGASASTVRRYMPERKKEPSGSWATFLHNEFADIYAIDFFAIPTLTMRVLYGAVLVDVRRRRLISANVATSINAEWLKTFIKQSCPFDMAPKYMIHDTDGIYGNWFAAFLKELGTTSVRTAFRAPRMNAICERVIGSVRRELFDHVIVLNLQHAIRLMSVYTKYYNEDRCHLSLHGDSPDCRLRQPESDGPVIHSRQILGGLHARYERRKE
jgi:putative transposase